METFDNLNEVPVVGKFYRIRCAKMRNPYGITYFVPIIGEKHKDKSFGPNLFHYHVDGRFSSKYVDEEGKTNMAVFTETKQGFKTDFFVGIEIKLRKCFRTTTGLKPPKFADKYYTWYDKQIGKSCKGKKCPHFGATMLEKNGRLVCPMHNLHGSIETEEIIPFENL